MISRCGVTRMPGSTRTFIGLFAALGSLSNVPAFAAEVHGHVSTAQGPPAVSAITLWAASADGFATIGMLRSPS
jgi:hypothetical protein